MVLPEVVKAQPVGPDPPSVKVPFPATVRKVEELDVILAVLKLLTLKNKSLTFCPTFAWLTMVFCKVIEMVPLALVVKVTVADTGLPSAFVAPLAVENVKVPA